MGVWLPSLETCQSTSPNSLPAKANALVERKNGAVVRKIFCHGHLLLQFWTPLIHGFNRAQIRPNLNFHRHCFFLEIWTDPKVKESKIYCYATMMTLYENLQLITQGKCG